MSLTLENDLCVASGRVDIERSEPPTGWSEYLRARGADGFHRLPQWLRVLQRGLGHCPYFLHAVAGGEIVGVLPLALVESRLFGRYLVSLPYLNSAGILADDPHIAAALAGRAVELAAQLDVRHLELRHEEPIAHPAIAHSRTDKVHMRLSLPSSVAELWEGLKSKVRNQVRKAQRDGRLTMAWGGSELLDDFYTVFCRNMRDLGTPPYPSALFRAVLEEFPGEAEVCCLHLAGRPVAGALLVHGPGVTEVPSASSLREFNAANVNMLMYWHLLQRAVERRRHTFDFGRSTRDGNTYRFKKQWGAEPSAAVWQYHVRHGNPADVRPESARYRMLIAAWKRLPVPVTRWVGPAIVRGIP